MSEGSRKGHRIDLPQIGAALVRNLKLNGHEADIEFRPPLRIAFSADVLGPPLLFGLLLRLGVGWKLQHCCVLTFLKMSQKNLLAVGHLEDIVMDTRLVLVLLAEDGSREPALNAPVFVTGPSELDGLIERKLGTGKNTNRRCVTNRIVN